MSSSWRLGRATSGLALLLLLVAACIPEGEPDPAPAAPEGRFDVGPEVVCEDVLDDFARLTPADPTRGLDVELAFPDPPGGNANAGVVLHDLDRDDDIDIALGAWDGPPRIFANDGDGVFTEVVNHPSFSFPNRYGSPSTQHVAVDLDGDRLPDLIVLGPGFVAWQRGLGALSFEEPELLYVPTQDAAIYNTLALGDVDGDQDLDIVLPGLCTLDSGEPGGTPEPSPDVLLINEGETFELAYVLDLYGQLSLSVVAAFTDRDLDGDFDILLPTDLGNIPPGELARSGFFRNDGLRSDGLPDLVNDAPEIATDLVISAMGIVNADLNGDGVLDYCITDVGPVRCLVSDPSGSYVDTGPSLGMVSAAATDPGNWSAWGLEMRDFDNNGIQDAAAMGGLPIGAQGLGQIHPDALWRGTPEGVFVDDSEAVGFAAEVNHYGLASADLDGDGFVELVAAGSGEVVTWWNRCGSGSWIVLDFDAPAPNTEAYGARMVLEAGGRTWIEELHALRGLGQGPSSIHVGLGAATVVDSVTVYWPDGAVTEGSDLPVNRTIRAVHPDLVQ